MDASPHTPRQAFWLEKCEPLRGGEPKRRPVIVVAPAGSLPDLPPGFVLVVATTTTPGDEDNCVYIDFGLPEPCWAVGGWTIAVEQERLGKWAGAVDGPQFADIVDAIEQDAIKGEP